MQLRTGVAGVTAGSGAILIEEMPAITQSFNDAMLALDMMSPFFKKLGLARAAVHSPRWGVGGVVVCIDVDVVRLKRPRHY